MTEQPQGANWLERSWDAERRRVVSFDFIADAQKRFGPAWPGMVAAWCTSGGDVIGVRTHLIERFRDSHPEIAIAVGDLAAAAGAYWSQALDQAQRRLADLLAEAVAEESPA